jgi:hypothetical protein
VTDDDDVLLLWAAEELLAAGRSGDAASKRVHRRNGEFFVDIGQRLRIDGPLQRPAPEGVGALLAVAFTRPAPSRRRS